MLSVIYMIMQIFCRLQGGRQESLGSDFPLLLKSHTPPACLNGTCLNWKRWQLIMIDANYVMGT